MSFSCKGIFSRSFELLISWQSKIKIRLQRSLTETARNCSETVDTSTLKLQQNSYKKLNKIVVGSKFEIEQINFDKREWWRTDRRQQ